MEYTPRIKKALQFAAHKHDGLYRKDSTMRLPALTHLISVAWLLADAGAEEEIIMSGLLHDTLEDTDTTGAELEQEFGKHVRTLVEAVSDPARDASGNLLPWKVRKDGYFKNLETAPEEAFLIVAADKIDNIESKLAAYEREGPELLKKWSQPTESYIWYHGTALEFVKKHLPDHPLTKRLAEAHKRECAMLSGL
jgi:(p)ppGpp synthase/HD superfamily hydrolase